MPNTQNAKLLKPQYRVVVELDAPMEHCYTAGIAETAMMKWVPNIKSIIYVGYPAIYGNPRYCADIDEFTFIASRCRVNHQNFVPRNGKRIGELDHGDLLEDIRTFVYS